MSLLLHNLIKILVILFIGKLNQIKFDEMKTEVFVEFKKYIVWFVTACSRLGGYPRLEST
jgi:hypothetical protein